MKLLRTISNSRVSLYYKEKSKFEKETELRIPLVNLVRNFGTWKDYLGRQSGPLEDRVPWITFDSASFLRSTVREGMDVFEWGMGGSTAFLLDIGVNLTSVEHNPEWYEKSLRDIGKSSSWNPNLIEPEQTGTVGDPINWSEYGTSDVVNQNARFKNYASKITAFDDESFDLILVDGRSRPACFHHALSKVRVGGHVLWDNTDRKTYQKEMNAVDPAAFKMLDFPGPSPYIPQFTRTTVWKRLK